MRTDNRLHSLAKRVEMPEQTKPEIISIPLVEETAVIAKTKEVTATVRVISRVETDRQTVESPIHREEVVVERTPVGRWVEGPLPSRQEGDTTIIPVVEEVVVLEKKFRLVEEVRITKHVTAETFRQTVDVRRNEVSVERTVNDEQPTFTRSRDQ